MPFTEGLLFFHFDAVFAPQRMLDPPRPVNTLPLITPDTIAAAAELIGCDRNRLPELRLICRSEPAKKSGQNIPKNRCRTTVAEPIRDIGALTLSAESALSVSVDLWRR